MDRISLTQERGEEGQPQQFLVRATFSSFSRPSHLKILVLPIISFLNVQPLQIQIIFENLALLGQNYYIKFSLTKFKFVKN